MKPYRGRIYHWKRVPFDIESTRAYYQEPTGLGYTIHGYTTDPPKLGTWWRTSWVLSHDLETGEVETRNSRYTLVGEETVSKT